VDRSGQVAEDLGGFASLTTIVAGSLLAMGGAFLVALIVISPADPYGGAVLLAVSMCLLGVAMLGIADLTWLVRLLLARSASGRRTIAAIVAFVGAAASFAALVADLAEGLDRRHQTWPFVLAGVSLLALAAMLAADPPGRRAARACALIWVLLIAVLGYRTWSDVRVEVVWLGPTLGHSATQVAFTATRSGAFEVRFQAGSCFEGRVIATGRYEWRPGDGGSSFGAAAWVDLPAAVLPLENGDLVRVCLRDGLAAGTGAGEVSDPPSFWPRS
jgi:hypothetical protein